MTESIVPEIISVESPVPAMELAFFSFPAPISVVIGGAADSQEQCSSSRDNGYGKCDVCGGVSKHSYALSDKDLVNDVVQSAD